MTENFESLKKAAGELAKAIQADSRWIEWTEARKAIEQDEALRGMMARYAQLGNKARSGSSTSEALSGADILEMGTLQATIEGHANFARQKDATAAMLGLLHDANSFTSEGLGIDFAANAAPRESCCG